MSIINLKKNVFSLDHIKYMIHHRNRCGTCFLSTVISTLLFVLIFQHSFSASTTGTASAEILANLTISQATELNFGKIVSTVAGGNVTIDQSNTITACPVSLDNCTGGQTSGAFNITGTNGETVDISYTGGALTGTGTDMAFTVNGPSTLTLAGDGTGSVSVGGTLTVGANQIAGIYTGSYTVTVDY